MEIGFPGENSHRQRGRRFEKAVSAPSPACSGWDEAPLPRAKYLGWGYFVPVTRAPRGEVAQRLSDLVVSHDPVDEFVNSQNEALAPQRSTRLVSRARALH